MSDLIKIETSKPEIPENWDYETSIEKVKSIVYKWKNLTFEILRELWIAREVLSKHGGDRKSEEYQRDICPTDFTWEKYCQDIGIEKRTANRWLRKHFLESPIEKIESPSLPYGKYFVIYADPPWQYQNIGFDESAEQQYPTMSAEEICALPIEGLVTEKAVLFLWVTNAFIKEGIQIEEKYWVKVIFNNGTYWIPKLKEQAEIARKVCECEDVKYPYGQGRKMTIEYLLRAMRGEMDLKKLSKEFQIPERNIKKESIHNG